MESGQKKIPRSKANSSAAKVTSQTITEQTAAFLKGGGKITRIRSGVRDQEVPPGKETEQA